MERWLVISNCNTVGLSNSLRLLSRREVAVEAVHIRSVERALEEDGLDLGRFSRVFAIPKALELDGLPLQGHPAVHLVPALFFAAYHPDGTYVHCGNRPVPSPAGDYHSSICLAAFEAGLSPGDAISLYSRETYERAGWLDLWAAERATEVAKFAEHGIDIAGLLVRWARNGPFMHTFNHPVVGCIFDTARAVLGNLGIDMHEPPFLPDDFLRQNTWLPVYPEIAEQCGVPGSTLFKRSGRYELVSLPDFVRGSYRAYARHGRGKLVNKFAKWDRVAKLNEIIGR